jgi:hypothetical protein
MKAVQGLIMNKNERMKVYKFKLNNEYTENRSKLLGWKCQVYSLH